MNSSQNLTDLPNISFVLAEQLSRIGIRTPEELAAQGAVEISAQLRELGNFSDRLLFSLEGAIQRVPWQSIPPTRRHELIQGSAISDRRRGA